MDIKKQSQSFQKITQKYKFIYSEIMSKYLNHQEIFTYDQVDNAFNKLIIQYKETDWGFLKRIASHHNVGLIPDIYQDKIAYYAGLPTGKNYETNNIPYKIERIPQTINTLLLNEWIENADENDFITYQFKNMMEYFKLGDNIIFKNLKWCIKSIHSHLDIKDNYLLHDYTITRENGCKQPRLINEQFVGASIEGIVIDQGHGFAKLYLEIDEKQDIDKASWLRYSNYYTAGAIRDG